jgi:hypothetical protein
MRSYCENERNESNHENDVSSHRQATDFEEQTGFPCTLNTVAGLSAEIPLGFGYSVREIIQKLKCARAGFNRISKMEEFPFPGQ